MLRKNSGGSIINKSFLMKKKLHNKTNIARPLKKKNLATEKITCSDLKPQRICLWLILSQTTEPVLMKSPQIFLWSIVEMSWRIKKKPSTRFNITAT